MAFGDERLSLIDDASAALSSARGRVRILGARLRMVLAELIGMLNDLDRAQSYWLRVRGQLSDEYCERIGMRR